MALLNDTLHGDIPSGYKAMNEMEDPSPRPTPPPYPQSIEPVHNPYMRCPLPIDGANPDGLRQFYQGNVAQIRILPIIPPVANTGGTTTKVVGTFVNGGTTSSGTVIVPSSTPTVITHTNTSLTTGTIIPNGQFFGSMVISRSFQLLSLAANRACRVQLYGTTIAQTIDASRLIDTAPPAETTQNIITDVVLDTSPFIWYFQSRVGANQNTPQTTLVYVTVTNLSMTSSPVITTLNYVPLETA